uniref:Uncharacterized protein n=1 Tax=Xiphophorus maculatus TaxID=8083 RepID=A0A3B5QBU1_XIPMA
MTSSKPRPLGTGSAVFFLGKLRLCRSLLFSLEELCNVTGNSLPLFSHTGPRSFIFPSEATALGLPSPVCMPSE